MKHLILFLLFSSVSANELRTNVITRNKNFKAKEKEVTLSGLLDNEYFESRDFKIVLGKNDRPISTKEKNKKILLKAATVFYHLHKAKKYFIEELNSPYVKEEKQITVRIEISNVFNELGHFSNDNLDPQFNNAVSVPAGKGYLPANIKPWGKEIWFRPMKKIKLKDLTNKPGLGSFKKIFQNFRRKTHTMNLGRFLTETFNRKVYEGLDTSGSIQQFIRTAGSSILLELMIVNANWIEWLFLRKTYWLDTALVPEIIYHEYAHQALSDSLELHHSTAVNEGMADYFAAKIAKSPLFAKKIKKHNTFDGKDAKNTKKYRLEFETNGLANTDFVLGLLWSVDKVIGKDAPKIIYELRKDINSNSNIRENLISSLIMSCRNLCSDFQITKYKLLRLFHLKGI